ncbi:hypothetical protein [Bacillus halotolerans]|uniref:Uncharacterized protein n=1 Tax=Bacillus halotolerans TaxID=260554 RepID=A0A9Q4EN03_9BACI|nr:hypothetical protein [Bacillus halotolerans]MCY9186660.1 hypothetical protein [Bacillus halotolerans]
MFKWNFFDSIEICNHNNELHSTETQKAFEQIVLDYNSDKNQFVYLISHRGKSFFLKSSKWPQDFADILGYTQIEIENLCSVHQSNNLDNLVAVIEENFKVKNVTECYKEMLPMIQLASPVMVTSVNIYLTPDDGKINIYKIDIHKSAEFCRIKFNEMKKHIPDNNVFREIIRRITGPQQ